MSDLTTWYASTYLDAWEKALAQWPAVVPVQPSYETSSAHATETSSSSREAHESEGYTTARALCA